jgi:acetylornithine aminotransferase
MSDLQASKWRGDARVAEARRLLQAALAEHSGRIRGVRPADPARAEATAAMLARFGELRGGELYFPYIASGLGRGPYVELADGSVKLDFISGIGVHGLGHSHPDWLDAAFDAALADTCMQGNLQQGEISIRFLDHLLALAGADGSELAHGVLTTSGAMANENALKLAFHRRHPADRVLAFEHAFAGRTLALAQITDRPAYRSGLPSTLAVDYLPFFAADDPAGSIERTLATLTAHTDRHPGKHGAMIAELVQGEGGYFPGDAGFFRVLFTRLRELGVSVIVDEIQTVSRTTKPFAYQYFGLGDLVDIVAVGKVTQTCATLYRADHRPPRGLISQTFTGSSGSMTAGLAVIECMATGDWGDRVARLERRFHDGLAAISERHPGRLRGPFGIGSMVAFTPLDGSRDAATRTVHALFAAGLMGFPAGHDPARVRFLPPVGCTDPAHIDEALEIIERVLGELEG